MDWYGLVVFVVVSLFIGVLIYDDFRSRLALKKSHATVTQLLADKQLVLDQIERLSNQKTLSENQEFVNFLTESREWAFNYIEQVHSAMEKFTARAEPLVKDNPELLELVNQLYDAVMPLDNPDS